MGIFKESIRLDQGKIIVLYKETGIRSNSPNTFIVTKYDNGVSNVQGDK